MRNNRKGFSLIELLIVVAIILIISAIAIPNLLRSRIKANEASAVGALRTIITSATSYADSYNGPPVPCGYPAALANLGPGAPATPVTADLIDATLAGGVKSGYNIRLVGATPDANGCLTAYTATAVPVAVGRTGQRSFFTDDTGVIRVNRTGAVPTVADPPL